MSKTVRRLLTVFCLLGTTLFFSGATVGEAQTTKSAPIRLQTTTFIPQTGQFSPEAQRLNGQFSAEPDYYLVQFETAIRPEWRQALIALGGDIVAYVPENAFKVRLTSAQISILSSLPYVNWIGRFLPAYKLSPELDQSGTSLVRVRLEKTAVSAEIATAITTTGATLLSQEEQLWLVAGTYSQLEAIAEVVDVAWIENYVLPEKHNEYGAGVVVGANIANNSGYDGSTQIAAVADTGLGGGTAATAHPDIPSSRITAVYSWPGINDSCFTIANDGAIDVDSGHGTHTAVSVVGDGGSNGEGKGTAPAANLVFQAVESFANVSFLCQILGGLPSSGYFLTGLPADLGDLYQQAYDDGARIHSNSWGANVSGAYNANSVSTDQFMWDNPDMLITFSAGNAGVDSNNNGVVDDDSIGSPATAKNVLTVGASEGDRQGNYQCDAANLTYTSTDSYQAGQTCGSMGGNQSSFLGTAGSRWGFSAEPLFSDVTAGNSEQMAPFSSRGPTDDGRIKPDVVAPGTWILSGYSELYQQDYGDPTNPQTGGYQSDAWGMPASETYKYMGGTSMSNPIAAGAATVVRDFYKKTDNHDASAALVKATLINSAVDLLDENNDGADDNDFPIPNMHEGWGRIDVAAATDGTHQYVDETTGINTSDISSYQFTTTMADLPLHISLVWTDYPSTEAAATNLVNDLDLRVTDPAGTAVYLGNNFTNGWSVTGGSADTLNNVENVYVQAAAKGQWTVEVIGTSIPNGPQPFALVVNGSFISGCQAPTSLTLAPDSSNIDLDWPAIATTLGYEVWWGHNSFYDDPGVSCSAASNCQLVTETSFTHTGVTYDADNNYSYMVIAGDCSAPGSVTDSWGVFSFGVTPGTP